jgi:hypothetical protein
MDLQSLLREKHPLSGSQCLSSSHELLPLLAVSLQLRSYLTPIYPNLFVHRGFCSVIMTIVSISIVNLPISRILIRLYNQLRCAGGFSKVFQLIMDDGTIVVARISNPSAGPLFKTTASGVATMDFVSWLISCNLELQKLI